MSKFLSSRFSALEPYTPGEQPRDMKYVKLNTNESPFPPSKKVIKAVNSSEVLKLNLYPDPTGKELISKLAATYGVGEENVFISNGSDDILNFSFMAFCDKEKGVCFPEISYGFYEVYAKLYGLDYKKIPLRSDFSINPENYYSSGKTVVIANPNAPTGLTLSATEIEEILKTNSDSVVIIDEAYVDFGAESCVQLTKQYENLIVVMTYSKSRSLAGGRLGFAIANKNLIADLNTIKYSTNPYNINRLTMAAGIASLDSADYYKKCNQNTIEVREYTKTELEKRGFVLTDSKANFLFAKHPKIGGEKYYLALKSKGVLVRHFGSEKIKDYVRITIGTKAQMDILLKTTDQILREV
ncbi:MAG: histidinol-phosphate transaminase [Ruminococcaceae bacterium]|nr:histidinol-phosphate transaminase [Oscillospiraceae bacterium]